jgi:hypothetical protein
VSKRGLKILLEGYEKDKVYTKGVKVNALFTQKVYQKQIATKYCFWNDLKQRLRVAQSQHIRGIGGAITLTENLAPIFNLYLYLSPKDRPIQAMFSSFEEDQEALRIIRPVFSVVKDVDIFN